MDPRSPPTAVRALPMAALRAVPVYSFSEKSRASCQVWADADRASAEARTTKTVFFILLRVYLLPPERELPEELLELLPEEELRLEELPE